MTKYTVIGSDLYRGNQRLNADGLRLLIHGLTSMFYTMILPRIKQKPEYLHNSAVSAPKRLGIPT
jgi:hypothetical protein